MKVVRFEFKKNIYYGSIEGNSIHFLSDAPWLNGTVEKKTIPVDSVRLLAPCNPKKIIGVAINYPGATGTKSELTEPLVFIKPSTAVIGNNEIIRSPFKNIPIWGESELAIVIGKRLFRANKKEVLDGIFGYTIGNDVSADNVHGWDHHLARSKGADTFCALGPWVETDYHPDKKLITGYHNNELLRKGMANERIWKEPELLIWLSSWITLEPGDVILTGAPTRVRDRIFLKDGDIFKCVIEGLGELTNSFKLI